LLLALIAGTFGFSGIARESAEIGKDPIYYFFNYFYRIIFFSIAYNHKIAYDCLQIVFSNK